MRHVGRGALRRGPARAPEPPVPDPTSGRDEQISPYLRDHHVRCLQIEQTKHIEGWLSTDLTPGDQDTIFLDATEPFPFPDDCLDFVFGEHLIEHVSWWDGQRVLAECRRVLRPGGVLRLATPDAARLIDLYRGEAGAEGEHYLQWHHKRFTPLMRTHPLVVLNHNVRAWGHVFLYDAEFLSAALGDAELEQITPCELGDSTHPALRGVNSTSAEVSPRTSGPFRDHVLRGPPRTELNAPLVPLDHHESVVVFAIPVPTAADTLRPPPMARLCETDGLTDDQTEILKAVRQFVEKEILPVATELEHKDEYPTEIVEGLKELGLFGLMIPEEYGGLGESLLTYALAVEEIARGWMSVSGIINTHFIVAYMLLQHGTEEQKQKYLPRMAAGEVRGAFSMSEPGCGSDVAAIKTKAVKDDDGGYSITGQKMWLTNGGSANLVAVLVKTDEGADSVYKNMTTFLVEKEEGFGETAQGVTIPGKIEKMGYKGVDTTEMVLEGHRISADQILGGEPGKGFYQMMDGVEVGRVNVAARGCGVANRAFELGVTYAQQRETFGKKIAEHQAVLFRLAEMATKIEAAHQMMVRAARKKDAGARNDLEAGMAKYLASEYCSQVVEDSFRIHGGYGFSKEYEIERLYREAPMLLIGEGTADIQRMIIGRRLLEDYKL